jgi:hypothetical protein
MFLAADAAEALRHHLRWYQELSDGIEGKRPDLFTAEAAGSTGGGKGGSGGVGGRGGLGGVDKDVEKNRLIDEAFARTGDLHVATEEVRWRRV